MRVHINNPFNDSPAVNGNERNHAQDAIWLGKIEDAWVRHCTTLHFVASGFKTSIATRVTIDSCSAIDPISIITGERRYNFCTYTASQLILFRNCFAKYARHAYVSNGTSTVSGIVFYNCVSEESFTSSEGHRLWSQGLLYDNFSDINTNVSGSGYVLGLYNRGNMGSGHGWASVHSVAWNCNVGTRSIIIQQPPTGQNYGIGCIGNVTGIKPPAPFNQPQGYIEGTNVAGLNPPSLYRAQFNDRLNIVGIRERDDRTTRPATFALLQNFPNPFNPGTTIEYTLSERQHVSLQIFDISGRLVAVLVQSDQDAGRYSIRWNASSYANGAYFLRLRAGHHSETKKLILEK